MVSYNPLLAEREGMGKRRVSDFDPSVCLGEHPAATGPCPHLVPIDADTGRPIIDRLRRAEAATVGRITDMSDGACGMCSCPLKNLAVLDMAPDECPRIHLHDQ